jgi:class 3 adenylate cyclase
MEMKKVNLCILLLDLVGSTKFVQRYGNEHAAKIFQAHDKLTRSLIYRFRGREIDRSDGFLMSFNSAIDAVNFGLHYHKTIPPRTTIKARIGIHWGEIIEVAQEDKFIDAGAKRIELEGISKNTAARIMSLSSGGQICLSTQAFNKVRNRSNMYTPKDTRYACAGVYKLKGIKEPIDVYMVGISIESLQPPGNTDKVKKIAGPKKIKSRARDRKIKEWFWYVYPKLGFISFMYLLITLWPMLSRESTRLSLDIDSYFFWTDYVNFVINIVIDAYNSTIGKLI